MAKNDKQTLTPRLRFPEFRDQDGWCSHELGPMTGKVGSGITPTGGEATYKSSGRPFVRSQNVGWGELILDDVAYIDEEMHRSFDSSEIAARDVLLNITGASIGRSAIADSRIVGGNVNQHVCIIRVKPDELNPVLLNQYLISEHGQKQIDSFQAGGNRQGLNFGQIRSFKITLPPTSTEQQKIADCLTSLDAVVAAQGQKVEALKTHKKGLMQQLFPREGETLPRLRFPEFRNAGEWSTVSLGELLAGKPEYGVNAAAVPFSENLPAYLRITDIDDDGRYISSSKVSVDIDATEENYLCDGDIALARTGASVGKSYRYRPEDGRLVFAGFLIRIRPDKKKVVPTLLSNYMTTQQYWDWVHVTSARSGQPGINGTEYATLSIPIPPPSDGKDDLAEQQRIAACLCVLDARLAAESAKLNALKMHKKGLMQQLFPSPEGDL